MHISGPKRNFDERLGGPERGYEAGFRRIGLGVLVGLADWRRELVALAAHVSHLMKVGWRSQVTLALPRLRPSAGGFQPRVAMSDRDFVRAICAFPGGVSAGGDCFVHERAGEVAGWVDGAGGNDDECGV